MRAANEHYDTLNAAITKAAGVRAWTPASPLERATLVLDHCTSARIDAAGVTPAQLSVAMSCMPLQAQQIGNFVDMACALAAVLPTAALPALLAANEYAAEQSAHLLRKDCDDSDIVQIDVTVGWLREVRDAITKATQVPA